jgi:signal transduction histidine kinase
MTRMPASALPMSIAGQAARVVARRARDGLAQTLAGSDQAPHWHWRSPYEQAVARTAIGLATLLLGVVSFASMHAAGPLQPLALWERLLALAVIAPLPLAVRYPLLAWRIGWAALLLVPLAGAHWWGGWPWGPPQIVALLVAFCVAAVRYGRPVLWSMWALTLIPWSLWLRIDVPNLHGPIGATIVFAAIATAADSVGSRLRTERELTAQTARTEAEQANRAVLEERARIARELHDVVAHHMSLVAVQAETAPFRHADLPESARAEFGALSGVAREALAEMRRLLGVLRQDEPAALAPQPQLSDLPALIEAARRAGVQVVLSAPPALELVPAGVGLCAYRIVQESLTNASQHAPGAAVTVSVERTVQADHRDSIVLRVANGPGRPANPARAGQPGHGLAGMRERVSLLGGELSAAAAPDGGFVVSAEIPLGIPA